MGIKIKYNKISFFIMTLCFYNCILAQEACFSVDSVKVHYLPWDLQTTLSLSSYDVRNFNELNLHKTVVISDSLILSEFISLLPLDKISNKIADLDIRMVLDIYFTVGMRMTLSLDRDGYFEFSGKEYRRDLRLVKWVNNNIKQYE